MRITVVTVCFNAERTIADTIRSVLAQSHESYEHIIVDGASTDGTLALVRSLQHDRMKVLSEPDKGLYDAMNKGAALASGDFVGFLNSDDFFGRTDALSLISAAAERHPQTDAVSAGALMVDPDQLDRIARCYRSTGWRPWMLRFGHMPPHPGFYTRTNAFQAVGGFDTSYRMSSDFEWMVRFYRASGKTSVAVREPVVVMRNGGISTRGLKSTLAINADVGRALRDHGVWSAVPLIWSRYVAKAGQTVMPGRGCKPPTKVCWKPDYSHPERCRAY